MAEDGEHEYPGGEAGAGVDHTGDQRVTVAVVVKLVIRAKSREGTGANTMKTINKIENLLGPLRMCCCDLALNCYSIAIIAVPWCCSFIFPSFFCYGAAVLCCYSAMIGMGEFSSMFGKIRISWKNIHP